MDGGRTMIPLPRGFTDRMRRQLGEELTGFLNALALPPVRGIRMNKTKPFDGMDYYTSLEKIPWTDDAYLLTPGSLAGATVFHEAGAFYIQEPAAMIPVEVLNPQPGEHILDLCAAPGGKSTQIALRMLGQGLVICNEPVPKRAQVLSRNIERMGIANSIVTCSYPAGLPHGWNGTFDGVLVDAPCSGEGMFRRDPETRVEWTEEQAAGCARRQAEILREAARFVKPGGRLVYATCTYNPEENERNIELFLTEHSDFIPEDFSVPCAEGKNGMFLNLPHRTMGEGQFAALLRRRDGNGSPWTGGSFTRPGKECVKKLLESFPGLPEANAVFGNTLVRVPDAPDMKGVRVLRAGLHLAEIRGKNVIPDHAAAIAVTAPGTMDTELSAADARAYIAGNETAGDNAGWSVMRYRGLALGWGKGSEGRIRNHYPKGLRKEGILTEPS